MNRSRQTACATVDKPNNQAHRQPPMKTLESTTDVRGGCSVQRFVGRHCVATLILGDCRDVLPLEADAVVTDPPYGMDWNFSGQGSGRNAQGGTNSVTKGQRIQGDAEDFDPTHLLQYERVIIWGMHHFPNRLQRGSVLVWVKKYPDAYGTFLSDADLAWMKGGCGVYVSKTMNPAKYQAEKCHPTQKPVPLMAWCIEKTKLPKGSTILDPYMGSGTTGLAAIRLGDRKSVV